MKICTKCNLEKPLDEFFARKGASDGKMSCCKSCKTKAIYEWRAKNSDHLNEYQRQYAKTEKSKATMAKYRARPDVIAREKELEAKRRLLPSYKESKRKTEMLETTKTYRRNYRKTDEVKAKAKAHRDRPDVKARRAERVRLRRASVPKDNINSRMSNAIGQAIRKNRRSWVSILGYSCGELMDHLEKQFLKGMGWHNVGDWHIDHIVPKSSFNYETESDPEFKACWGLVNLRPLWAEDNHRKHAKQIFLM